jgi:hypothetical protein
MISQVIVVLDQTSRQMALDRRIGEHPTSMPMTEPSIAINSLLLSPFLRGSSSGRL